VFLIPSMHATCPAHVILLDLMTLGPCVTFHNKLFFCGEELLGPCPTPKLKNHPISGWLWHDEFLWNLVQLIYTETWNSDMILILINTIVANG
jgi:hypothetical protein